MTEREWGIPYEGTDLPVTEEWIEEHGGDYIAFELNVTLEDLIECGGIDDFMEHADDLIGTSLSDCSWRLTGADPEYGTVIIRYVGMVPEDL